MGHMASRVVEGSVRAVLAIVFCAVLLALTLLFAASANAQETTAETAEQTEGTTATVMKAQETTAQADKATTVTVTKDEKTVVQSQDMSTDEPKQSVQQSAQLAQANPTEDDDSRATTRAATTLRRDSARITESTNDSDEIVDRIVVPVANCEVEPGAVVIVEDNDDTRVRLTDGQNVTITRSDAQIVIVGTDTGGNLTDLDPNGVNQQFGTLSTTVMGEVVGSSGITCNDGDAKADDDDTTVAGGCTTLRLFEGDERQSETFGIPSDSTGRLRIVYSTLNDDGELTISVGTVQTRASGLSETVRGSESGVIRGSVDEEAQIAISVVPTDQDYRIVLESIGGDDECTTPKAVRGVLTESIPDDEQLPETGGVPLSVLAGCVALLLVGTALVGTAARRRM